MRRAPGSRQKLLPDETVSAGLPLKLVRAICYLDCLHGQERDVGASNLADAKAHLSELVDRARLPLSRRGRR